MGSTSSAVLPPSANEEGEKLLLELALAALNAAQNSQDEQPTAAAEKEMCELMDRLRPAHLGLDGPRPAGFFRASNDGKIDENGNKAAIRTQTVFSNREFEIVVFLFPAGAAIPLHDHPKMTVLSKVLYGALAMKSFDWAVPPTADDFAALTAESSRQEARAANCDPAGADDDTPLAPPFAAFRRAETVLNAAAPTCCLRPTFGNIHSFEALSETAVLDLLMPPYDDDLGRDCHYFEAVGQQEELADGSIVLRAAAEPDSLVIRSAPYMGPRIDQQQSRPPPSEVT